jgi:hypothetical protein
MPRSRGPNRPDTARESTCSSTCREAEGAPEALGREEEQEAEDSVPPTRHSDYAGLTGHCPRQGPPDTRCGTHAYPTGHLGTGHLDRYTGNRLGTNDSGDSRIRPRNHCMRGR